MDASSAIIILITVPASGEAREIARTLVHEKLVACATIIPRVTSFYWWEAEVCEDEEVLIIAKSRKTLFTEIMNRVKSLHSCQVPEILSVPICDGLPAYVDWIKNVTK